MENLILAMLIREIRNEVVGSLVEDVSGFAPVGFALRLRKEGRQACSCLAICLDPGFPAAFLIEEDQLEPVPRTPAETLPEGFVRSMSDRLRGATIDEIEQHNADRVVRVQFSVKGRRAFLTLWLELFGRRPNAILVEGGQNEIAACSREGTTSAAGVLLRSGEKYVPPSGKGEFDVKTLSLRAVQDVIESVGLEPRTEELGPALSRLVRGLSPNAAREIVRGVSADECLTPEALTRGLKEALAEPDRHFRPAVRAAVSGTTGPPAVVPVYVRTRRDTGETGGTETAGRGTGNGEATRGLVHFPTASQAVRFSFLELCRWHRVLAAGRFRRDAGALSQRLRRLGALLTEDLSSARRAREFRTTGELILANVKNIKRGSTRVELKDIHADGQSFVNVELDPSLSPSGNAERYFKKAGKAERALTLLKKRTASIERLLQAVERFRDGIPEELDARGVEEASRRLDELANLARRPIAAGQRSEIDRTLPARQARSSRQPLRPEPVSGTRFPPSVSKRRAGARTGGTFNPRIFETSDGFTMIVGRNNKENDHVTHRLAKPEDLWFHASAVPGSHVVLRKKGKCAPSRRAIEEAACVAAYFSKGRTSSSVPVIYTAKKYVHKPRGSRPGTATCTREKFIMVAPRKPKTRS